MEATMQSKDETPLLARNSGVSVATASVGLLDKIYTTATAPDRQYPCNSRVGTTSYEGQIRCQRLAAGLPKVALRWARRHWVPAPGQTFCRQQSRRLDLVDALLDDLGGRND